MNYTLVGAFVLTLGMVLIAVSLWLASGGAWQKKYKLYQAVEDESVAGLNLNAAVKYNGVDVGNVRAISLDPANPQRVNLLFAIEDGTPIKEDTLAVLKTQGLTGIAYVELSGGAATSPPLRAVAGKRYPVIRTKPSLSARLENVLTSLLGKLDSTSSSINALLSEENQIAFKSALADVATVAHTVAVRKDTIDAGITHAGTTLHHTSQATAQLATVVNRIGRSADAVTRTSVSAGKAVDAIGVDVQRFSTETLPEIERLLGELSTLSRSLRHLSEQIARDPRGLLLGPAPIAPGPGEAGFQP